jgi:predicted AlkP superfamily pyrophosphatase or phosphodiesterase
VIFGIDGIGCLPEKFKTPLISKVIESGAYTFQGITAIPTVSTTCWGTMLHGVPPELHGVTSPRWNRGFPLDFAYPSFVKVVRQAFPTRDIAVFANWSPIIKVLVENISYSRFTSKNDTVIVQHTLDYLENHNPVLLFLQLDECDVMGHKAGYFTKEHEAQLLATDEMMQRICNKLDEKKLNNRLLLFVTDHGGNGTHHGGESEDEVKIFFGAMGSTVARRNLSSFYFEDIAAIVLNALKVEPPSSWTAKVPEGLFVER